MASKAKSKSTRRARPAHPKPDPIFAAIAAHRKAEKAFEKASDEESTITREGARLKAAEVRMDKASDVSLAAFKRLCRTGPASVDGLLAMLSQIEPHVSDELDGLYRNGATKGLWGRMISHVRRLTEARP